MNSKRQLQRKLENDENDENDVIVILRVFFTWRWGTPETAHWDGGVA